MVRERINEKWEWSKGNLKGGLMVEKRVNGEVRKERGSVKGWKRV